MHLGGFFVFTHFSSKIAFQAVVRAVFAAIQSIYSLSNVTYIYKYMSLNHACISLYRTLHNLIKTVQLSSEEVLNSAYDG